MHSAVFFCFVRIVIVAAYKLNDQSFEFLSVLKCTATRSDNRPFFRLLVIILCVALPCFASG